MKLAKRLLYKLIVILCILATFFSFVASTPVDASKVSKTEFYYSGTQKGSYTVGKNFFEKLVGALDDILDYILGILILVPKMVFVGWTALMEQLLTGVIKGISGIEGDITEGDSTDMYAATEWITLDAIFFNRVPILNVNVFDFDFVHNDPLGKDLSEEEMQEIIAQDEANEEEFKKKNKIIILFKELIAGWYYSLRLVAIMVMLIILIYIGIKLAIKSVATEKALYKKVLVDWLVGMIMVFFIHYIMLTIFTFNEVLLEQIGKWRLGAEHLEVYEYGLEERAEKISNEEMEYTLYDEVKTRAYDPKLTVGMSGMIMYMVLVYYEWKYTFIYLKRYLTVAVLVIMAPIVSVSYAFNKVKNGKATSFINWLKEFFFIVILQSIHALMYVIFIQQALAISLSSIAGFIISLMMFNFMSKAEGIFRKIFNVQGNLTSDIAEGGGIKDAMNSLKATAGVLATAKVAKAYTKGVARLATKPIRVAGSRGFGKYMEKRAKNLNAEARKEGYEDYTDKRLTKKVVANYGKRITDRYNELMGLKAEELEIQALKEGQKIVDELGNEKIVDSDYINKRKEQHGKKMAKLNEKYADVDKVIKEYKDKTKSTDDENQLKMKFIETYNESKKYSTYFKDKWAEIMDPNNYTEAYREETVEEYDKYGNKVQRTILVPGAKRNPDGSKEEPIYKARKTERECGRFGKKIEGVEHRMAQNMNIDNIFNLNKDEKKALKDLANFGKSTLLGFTGILVGIPAFVADPKAGIAILSVGASNTSKVLDDVGRARKKTLSRYSKDVNGKFVMTGFEGASKATMARGAKILARDQMEAIAQDKVMAVTERRKRHHYFEKRHPGFVRSMRFGGTAGTVAATTLVASNAGVPVLATALGTMGAVKLNGSIASRFGGNLWAKMEAIERASEKHSAKDYKDANKNKTINQYLDIVADYYFKMNRQENQAIAESKTEVLIDTYLALESQIDSSIANKTEEELDRDSKYEEEIEYTVTDKGEKQLTAETEDKLIEEAMIESALKCGIIDLKDFDVDKGMLQIEKVLETKLISQGILGKNEKLSKIIKNMRDKTKRVQNKIVDSGKSRDVVEERMAGDAVIKVMQEKGVTDPSQVRPEDVFEQFTKTYESSTIEGTRMKAKNTSSILEQLQNQRSSLETSSTIGQSKPKSANEILERLQSSQGLGVNVGSQGVNTSNVTESSTISSIQNNSVGINQTANAMSASSVTASILGQKPVEQTQMGVDKEKILVMIRDRQRSFGEAAKRPSVASLEKKRERAKTEAVSELNRLILEATQAKKQVEDIPSETNASEQTIPTSGTVVAGATPKTNENLPFNGQNADDVLTLLSMNQNRTEKLQTYVNKTDMDAITALVQEREAVREKVAASNSRYKKDKKRALYLDIVEEGKTASDRKTANESLQDSSQQIFGTTDKKARITADRMPTGDRKITTVNRYSKIGNFAERQAFLAETRDLDIEALVNVLQEKQRN